MMAFHGPLRHQELDHIPNLGQAFNHSTTRDETNNLRGVFETGVR